MDREMDRDEGITRSEDIARALDRLLFFSEASL
jgi:hypothetical protein